jgi:outer membrane receptor protein involved in Fe transport
MLLKRKYLFGTTILAGVIAVTAPAFAQTPSASQDPEATEIDEVIVTGSRIRRDPTTAPTPLIQVSRDDLLATGQTTVIDYLATIPALANSQVPSDTTGGLNALGLSLPNLRSLGAGRTLTLVDGRRHVGSSTGSLAVDVDTIPRLLIENIEIVTGGASSVYGADAVSGVLNFILRRDFEGLEVDGNYGMINKGGEEATQRFSVLAGVNLLDDRLNLYAFGEYEDVESVNAESIEWLADAHGFIGNDADPATAGQTDDGVLDAVLYRGLRQMQIRRGGILTIAGGVQPSPTNDPDVPNIGGTGNCLLANGPLTADCYNPRPGRTYVFDSTGAARLADFGVRVGNTGRFQSTSIGGDGENPALFNREDFFPQSESQRFQVGGNLALSPTVNLRAEIKYVIDDTTANTGPAFANVYITDAFPSIFQQTPVLNPRTGSPQDFLMRLDNAFLPANVLTAINANIVQPFGSSTATLPGAPLAPFAAPWARYTAWSADRRQFNTRELMRYVVSIDGSLDNLGFLRDVDWELGYTRGEVENENIEQVVDGFRYGLAIDAVRDTANLLGTPNAIVCRARLLTAGGATIANQNTGAAAGSPGALTANSPEVRDCRPYNIFGEGAASPEALAYITAFSGVTEKNQQDNAIAVISGNIGDPWGAGDIGVAAGVEYRSEQTTGQGRTQRTAGRWLLGNIGDDWSDDAQYTTKEFFGEVAIPLFRDGWLGTYAELSASYRFSDFSTTGGDDVYGVNLVYRPIPELAFKTSFNTSTRSPDLNERFGPRIQTFSLLTDPCDAQVNATLADRTIAAQRIANCTLQAVAAGLGGVFNFSDPAAVNAFRPIYTSSVSGAFAGNPALVPETSTSFTFSTAWQPSFIDNLSLVLDYYEIEIENVLSTVTGQTSANLCVNGPTLNDVFCDVITRSPVDLASPGDDRFKIVDFLQASFNFAKRSTRGLDFTGSYNMDLAETTPWDLGNLSFRVRGSWLIEQKTFNNISNPNDFTESASTTFFPRVRMTTSVAWAPTDTFSATYSVDWQSAQDLVQVRNAVGNLDQRAREFFDTGNFARHDLAFRYAMRDDLDLRFGVTNLTDAQQARHLGTSLFSNFDPYGRRFNVGFSWRPY